MAQSQSWFIDPEGFYDVFKESTKARSYQHFVYFTKDIIRNELVFQEKKG